MRFVVSGKSMEPKYFDGDKLFVSKILYRFLKPHRGGIVVVHDPRTGRLIVKRIESVEDNKYFVMGDNSARSTDSREFGVVEKSAIVGKVILRYSSPR